MNSRFEDLWGSAADDGASCLSGTLVARPDEVEEEEQDDEVDSLLEAWFRERTDRIECVLVLAEVRRLLRGLLADGEISPHRRRHVRRAIRAIRNIPDEGTS